MKGVVFIQFALVMSAIELFEDNDIQIKMYELVKNKLGEVSRELLILEEKNRTPNRN